MWGSKVEKSNKTMKRLIMVFMTILSSLLFCEGAPATDAYHQISQKAAFSQEFSISGTDKPCESWPDVQSGNGVVWSLLTITYLTNGNCFVNQNQNYRLVKESSQGLSVIRFTDIGIPEGKDISWAGHRIIFKVNSLGQAVILWNNSGKPTVTIVQPDNTARSINLDAYACTGGSAHLEFDGANPLIIWAPSHPNPDPNQTFCDSLLIARLSASGSAPVYQRVPWGDTPPSAFSADFSFGRLATLVLNRTLLACAVRSFPIDPSKVGVPNYVGAYLVNYNLDSNQTSVTLMKSATDGTSLDCGFTQDALENDVAIMLSENSSQSATRSVLYKSAKAEPSSPWIVMDLTACPNAGGQAYGLNQWVAFCSSGTKYFGYSRGILQLYGPSENLFLDKVSGPNGHALFYGNNQVSGSGPIGTTGAMVGFDLTYVDYLGLDSAKYRGNIELAAWCDPKANDPQCNVGSKVYQSMFADVTWIGDKPTFYVLAISGNEITYSKVLNTTIQAPSLTNLSTEQSGDGSFIITAQSINDGISPVLRFSWQQSHDGIVWQDISGQSESSIKVSANNTQKSIFYRAIAQNIAGSSKPTNPVEIKGIPTQLPSASTKVVSQIGTKVTSITCIKGKVVKSVSGVKPICPAGYKRK
jgi:hypothetical protein